mgnify:FL=1
MRFNRMKTKYNKIIVILYFCIRIKRSLRVVMSNPFTNLTKKEWGFWMCSLIIMIASNVLSGDFDVLTLIAACIGVTSLIFAAKGNVWSQILMIIFSILYGIISWQFRYWGEMITYLGMTMLRSSYYAMGYATNDIVLIVLWILASIHEPRYISVTIIFVIFFCYDMYGFVSWKKREVMSCCSRGEADRKYINLFEEA